MCKEKLCRNCKQYYINCDARISAELCADYEEVE